MNSERGFIASDRQYPRSGPLDARPGATRSGGEPPSLDALVRDPARVADLSTEERASVLIQIAGLAAALAVPPPASAAPGTDEYLKVQDVADELQVSRGTVYELVRTGACRRSRWARARRCGCRAGRSPR